jgi:hypothetical protein
MTSRQDSRIETGTLAFGEDWPGTFIRGDDSHAYAVSLDWLLKLAQDANLPSLEATLAVHHLEQLSRLLKASDVHQPPTDGVPQQTLKRFADCLKGAS